MKTHNLFPASQVFPVFDKILCLIVCNYRLQAKLVQNRTPESGIF
jgi:hypothetical protein